MSDRVFFTSDTHFGHTGALKFRPQFTSMEEMNELMIIRWNERVKPGDRVYHCGDFGFQRDLEPIVKRLSGQIHLILGNHDKLKAGDKGLFASIRDAHYLKVYDQKIYLHHYACRTWRGSHRGSWHLYGHSHGKLVEDGSRSFDCGVDAWDFYPVSFEQVAEKMKDKTFTPVDHHVEDEE